MEPKNVDHNLMLALLALKMGLIDNEAMVAALNAWAAHKDRSVGRILVAHEAVAEARLFLAEQAMTDLLDSCRGDPQQAMIALRLPAGLVETNLERIIDPELRAALARLESAETPGGQDTKADPLKTEFDPKLAATAPPPRPRPRPEPSTVDLTVETPAGPPTEQATAPPTGDPCATQPAPGDWPSGPATEALGAALPTAAIRTHGAVEQPGGLPATQPLPSSGLAETVDVDVATGTEPGNGKTAAAARPPRPASGPIRYRSLRSWAKGGLGEVFVALDEELGREVALKEIQGRHADKPESRARFLVEAEVTGGLEHPGIVPVYGLGQYPDGRPYYAMRFIRGKTLKDAIDAYHDRENGTPDTDPGARALELRALLNRLIAVCNALAYAHTRGVLHRDIKPANIMLGGFGETLVVDWGLAKTLDKPETECEGDLRPLRPFSASASGTHTMQGSAVGTPNFMSPEQAEGANDRVGPASDVYSIGATLYTILTGRPPFHEPQLALLLNKVKQGQFPRPRAVNSEVPQALEAICLKAMALAPEERYPDARALADDLEHWLADEPVSVYREPWTARLARWARRHRTLVTTAAALVLTALVALGIGTVLIQREQARTEANFQLARGAVDEMLTRLAAVELVEIPQMEPVRRNMLGKALAFYQTFLAQHGGDRSIRRETGRANLRLGDVEEMLGDYVAAEAAYTRAIALLGEHAASRPADGGIRRDLATAHHQLGVLVKKSNRFTEADRSLGEALRLRQALATADPDNADDQQAAMATVYQMGTVLARLGRVKEVETAYAAAIDAERKLAAAHPDQPGYPRELARYLNNRGILERSTSADRKAAQDSFTKALGLLTPLAEKSPTVAGLQWERARTTSNLAGTVLTTQGAAQAIPVYRDALALLKQLADDFPSVPDYQSERAVVAFNLGLVLTHEAQHRLKETQDSKAATLLFGQAEEQFNDALAVYQRLIRPERFPHRPDYKQRLAEAEGRLGMLLFETGRPREAEPHLRAAVKTLEDLAAQYPQVPEYQSDLGTALRNLATGVHSTNRAEAQRLLERAIHSLQGAYLSNARNPDYRTFLLDAYTALEVVLRESRDHAGLAEAADSLFAFLHDDSQAAVRSARMLDASAALAAASAGTSESERNQVMVSRAERALKRLQEAVKNETPVAPEALDAPAFGAIRARFPGALEALKKALAARVDPRVG
jgi:serine/threonine-protein kinase